MTENWNFSSLDAPETLNPLKDHQKNIKYSNRKSFYQINQL